MLVAMLFLVFSLLIGTIGYKYFSNWDGSMDSTMRVSYLQAWGLLMSLPITLLKFSLPSMQYIVVLLF